MQPGDFHLFRYLSRNLGDESTMCKLLTVEKKLFEPGCGRKSFALLMFLCCSYFRRTRSAGGVWLPSSVLSGYGSPWSIPVRVSDYFSCSKSGGIYCGWVVHWITGLRHLMGRMFYKLPLSAGNGYVNLFWGKVYFHHNPNVMRLK